MFWMEAASRLCILSLAASDLVCMSIFMSMLFMSMVDPTWESAWSGFISINTFLISFAAAEASEAALRFSDSS